MWPCYKYTGKILLFYTWILWEYNLVICKKWAFFSFGSYFFPYVFSSAFHHFFVTKENCESWGKVFMSCFLTYDHLLYISELNLLTAQIYLSVLLRSYAYIHELRTYLFSCVNEFFYNILRKAMQQPWPRDIICETLGSWM